MATVYCKDDIVENKIEVKQGDYVYCKATGGAVSFWGIYSEALKKVISLDGAGDQYIGIKDKLYVGNVHSCWMIERVIRCDKAIINISERR